MKMKDLNEKYGDDDFGIGNRGSELDNDERDMGEPYDQVGPQARTMGNIGGGGIKTRDGGSVEVTADQALFLQNFIGRGIAALYPTFGIKPAYGNDPDAMEKANRILATKQGLELALSKGPK
jgi:hypothetical protein|tara:strand:+ start:1160 stop:1525 length:366 start_codon:yes stop_codon:yes gene_type:complete